MTFAVQSAAFHEGAKIPQHFSGEGDDVSPPIKWQDVPSRAKELALVCLDPDAPSATPWVHWVLYKISPTVTELSENMPKTAKPGRKGAEQGKNSWGRLGYGGPMPPPGHGLHHYHFTLYALDQPLNLRPGATFDELQAEMTGHIIGEAELVGTYERRVH